MSAVPTPLPSTVGKTCAVCQHRIQGYEPRMACPSCGEPLHLRCCETEADGERRCPVCGVPIAEHEIDREIHFDWRIDGKAVVAKSEVELPPVCIVTGESVPPEGLRKKKIYYTHPAAYLSLLAGGPAVRAAGSRSDRMLFETVPLTDPSRIHREVLERQLVPVSTRPRIGRATRGRGVRSPADFNHFHSE
ncbi:hypothetical protein [Stratiformator vulcanicus]|uniref:RING-type domain-containing protein n=1 Tax=Stratiformator vulcanicus TaxID=2527980 RepID=A0A517QVS9_9PLAN|nr:hypothetical protein [Stratiformator vulcanicus]QDT35731.1 hypothetical protein Pan189_00840 [Stratiformator vulcanicus]